MMIFFNVVVGLTSALVRNIFSLVFGLLLMPRLDQTVMMKGFERWDAGKHHTIPLICSLYNYSLPNRVQNLHWIPIHESLPQ